MRASLLATATINFFNFVFFALVILYANQYLHIQPGALGAVIAVAVVGRQVIGSIVAGRIGGARLGSTGTAAVVGGEKSRFGSRAAVVR